MMYTKWLPVDITDKVYHQSCQRQDLLFFINCHHHLSSSSSSPPLLPSPPSHFSCKEVLGPRLQKGGVNYKSQTSFAVWFIDMTLESVIFFHGTYVRNKNYYTTEKPLNWSALIVIKKTVDFRTHYISIVWKCISYFSHGVVFVFYWNYYFVHDGKEIMCLGTECFLLTESFLCRMVLVEGCVCYSSASCELNN